MAGGSGTSTVLLVTLENVRFDVTVDVLHPAFSVFGAVSKIVVFEQNGVHQVRRSARSAAVHENPNTPTQPKHPNLLFAPLQSTPRSRSPTIWPVRCSLSPLSLLLTNSRHIQGAREEWWIERGRKGK